MHSGANALGLWGEAWDRDVASGGNLLGQAGVPRAIVDGFLGAAGHLGDRLVAAMRAGLDAGGEAGPIHSAGLKLVREVPWPVADLRVDWTEGDPIAELAALWDLYRPQLDAYVTRALDPAAAPSFGVPGDNSSAWAARDTVHDAVAPTSGVAVPNPASASAEGSGATAGGREAAARGAVGRCPGSGPGRDGSTGALLSEASRSMRPQNR